MTLAQQLTELKKKFHEAEQVDGAIVLRVLDSMAMQVVAIDARLDLLGKTVSHVLENLEKKADKVPYTDPLGH